jgi:carboxypeptidase Q
MRQIVTLLIILSGFSFSYSQNSHERVIKNIFDNALLNDEAYNNLRFLCDSAPGRLLGSDESFKAMDFMENYFNKLGADTVFQQNFSTPAWESISTQVNLKLSNNDISLNADALGPSPSTPKEGIEANVIEVIGIEGLENLSSSDVKGKIVFFNKGVDLTYINTFQSYGSAVNQRAKGPALAAELGAAAVIVRSVSTSIDRFPHTGSTYFNDVKIPCAAISTMDADLLSQELAKKSNLKLNLNIQTEFIDQHETYNLIADIKGNEFPNEYIIIAGHIDSWFNSPGAHDDGAGCVQAADVLRVFKELNIENKRSIRVIMYMDEELFQSGGKAYADYSEKNRVINYLAIEADAGGFSPEGFTIDANDSILQKLISYEDMLKPYGICYIKKGGTGVDIGPLKQFNVPLVGYRTDTQRYMDLHHSANDTFDKINIRELQLGSGLISSLVYLIDQQGL